MLESDAKPFDTVAAVGVLYDQSKFLVIKRSQLVIAPGKICFPGGRMESGETIEEALAREYLEELGIQIKPERQIWESVTSWKCKVHWWQVTADSFEFQIEPKEVESYGWMSLEELIECRDLLESNREFLELIHAGELKIQNG